MNPFQRLPNEILDAIFIHLEPEEVWTTQQCSASTERTLDPHMRTRRHAIDHLMWWACENGNNQAVRKAISLGADVSILRALPHQRSEHSTVLYASFHPDTANLLLDLGARFGIEFKGASIDMRKDYERDLSPEFYKLCSDRGITEQFVDFQACIDDCLFERIQNWWFESGDYDAGMKRISILLELGASSVTLLETPEQPTVTTLSCLIRNIQDWYDHYSTLWGLPILRLLLSKRPNPNSPSLEMTRKFLNDPDIPISWDAFTCPIAAAVGCIVSFGTTEVMDLLLEAGAKLDLPTHTYFQPLAQYAYLSRTYDGIGYKYLENNGASFEPLWHPEEESVDDDAGASIPILKLCRDLRYFSPVFYGGTLLGDDNLFGVMKLFIERGAVRNVGIRFIKDVLRPMGHLPYDADTQPIIIERSYLLLKLTLQDDNLNPNKPGEICALFSEIADQAINNPAGAGRVNIIDPIIVAMLLQKGARLETRSRTKEARDHVISQLQRDPYNISFDI